MKTGLKTKWGLFLVIVLVFFTGQVVRAERSWVCEWTVTGDICEIIAKNDGEEEPSAIVVSDDCDANTSSDTINGIPFDKLNKYLEEMGLSPLAVGDWIEIQAHACPAEIVQLKACEIVMINDEEIDFALPKGNEKIEKKDMHPGNEKSRKRDK